MLMNTSEYIETVNSVKDSIRCARYKALMSVNRELVLLYWNVGTVINSHKTWGSKFIDNLARDIKLDFPDIKGFSVRNLKYMAKFASTYKDLEFVQTVSAQIPWSHNIAIMEKAKDNDERAWYIDQTAKFGWSYSVL